MPDKLWCDCVQPAGRPLGRCEVCGGMCPPSPEQDRQTADALGDVARGKTRLDPSGGGRPGKET